MNEKELVGTNQRIIVSSQVDVTRQLAPTNPPLDQLS